MKNIAPALTSLLLALSSAPGAWAQASCSSDGTPRPLVVFERFINADCEACWTDPAPPAPSARGQAVVLDWIVPGALGDDAPLSAAATSDALARLDTLARPVPARTDVHIAALESTAPAQLRVAQGPPFNDYLGAAITFTPARAARQHGPWRFHLALVESVPAGADGSAAPRNVVRNMLLGAWGNGNKLSKTEQFKQQEMRPVRIPEGAKPERLRLVGWVQDAQGRVVAAAQSRCQ